MSLPFLSDAISTIRCASSAASAGSPRVRDRSGCGSSFVRGGRARDRRSAPRRRAAQGSGWPARPPPARGSGCSSRRATAPRAGGCGRRARRSAILERGPIGSAARAAARRPTRSARELIRLRATCRSARAESAAMSRYRSPRRRRGAGARRRCRSCTTGPARSISMSVSSNASLPAIASRVISSRSAALVTPLPPLCGGWAAGMNRTRSRPMASAASVASHRWPTCGGSNVPPEDPDPRAGGRSAGPGLGAAAPARGRWSVVVAPLELGRADVHGRPRPGADPAQLEVDPRSARGAARSGRATRRSRSRCGRRPSRRGGPRTRRPSPSATTSQPSASGSKRWTRDPRPLGLRIARLGFVERRGDAARRASSPVPSCALTPSAPAARRRSSGQRSRTSGRSSLVTTIGIGRSTSARVVQAQLVGHRHPLVDWLARRAVDDADEHPRALDVAQELVAETLPSFAPSMRPGTSAITAMRSPSSSRVRTPRFG